MFIALQKYRTLEIVTICLFGSGHTQTRLAHVLWSLSKQLIYKNMCDLTYSSSETVMYLRRWLCRVDPTRVYLSISSGKLIICTSDVPLDKCVRCVQHDRIIEIEWQNYAFELMSTQSVNWVVATSKSMVNKWMQNASNICSEAIRNDDHLD